MEDRFSEPLGFEWGTFLNGAGARIRYGVLKNPASRGSVVVLGGFREPIEKYFEVVRDFSARGFDVFAMDWRGQGGSERYLPEDPMRTHSRGFDEQIETLRIFTRMLEKKSPLILVAQSMGGHLGLRFLKEHPDVFNAAILSAPMLNIMTGVIPRPAARLVARLADILGFSERYVPGGGPWSEARDVFEGNLKTHDPDRFRVQTEAYRRNPVLRMGDPTYGWLRQAFLSIDRLNQAAYLKSITTPILMQISGHEKVVDRAAAARAARLLPQCRRVDITAAKHEIWMERNDLRDIWIREVDAFLAHVQGMEGR